MSGFSNNGRRSWVIGRCHAWSADRHGSIGWARSLEKSGRLVRAHYSFVVHWAERSAGISCIHSPGSKVFHASAWVLGLRSKKTVPKHSTEWRRPSPPRAYRSAELDQLRRATSPFYSFNAELLAEWCCVSVSRAASFKDGTKEPSLAEWKLFELHAAGKVLEGAEWCGWQVNSRRGVLVDPQGNECSPSLLNAYWIMVQLCRHAVYELRNPQLIEAFERALRSAA